MKRTLWLTGAVCLLGLASVPSTARAEICEETPEHVEHEGAPAKRDVTDVVFSHVSNERELEFENPATGSVLKIELPQCKKAFGVPWLDLSITKHLVWMWIDALVLVVVMLIWRPKSQTPRGGQMALEMLVLFVRDELAKANIGEAEYKRYVPYLCSAFFFILTMNLFGLVPYTATPTGNLAVTAGLAVCTWVLTQVATMRSTGFFGYFAHLTGGTHPLMWIIMIPVEVLGLFTKPFALCVRLFANMVAGHIVIFMLLGLIFIIRSHLVAIASVPFAIAVYCLEIFVAFLQAYVFTMLSAVFIGMGVASGHHEHADDHGHADADADAERKANPVNTQAAAH
jgi:F-type H+-transporting ATPase subunit a